MNIQEYADRDMLAIDVANALAGELEAALLHNDVVAFAVPGGTTPSSFHRACRRAGHAGVGRRQSRGTRA